MAKNSKFLSALSGVILPVITAVVTIILFIVFRPQKMFWPLFVFNMLYTVFLELIIFCYIGFIRLNEKAESSNLFKLAKGNSALYYVLFGAVFMLIYNAALRDIPMRSLYYGAIILFVTLLWIIIGSIILRTHGQSKEKGDLRGDQSQAINDMISKMKVLTSRFSTLQSINGEEAETTSVDQLMDKFNNLSAKNVKNQTDLDKLNTIINDLDKMMDEAEAADKENYSENAEIISLYAKKNIGKVEQIQLNR